MKSKPSHIILALGANDGLRGFSPDVTKENLSKTIEYIQSEQKNIRILLAGIQAPLNMGEEYTNRFKNIFPNLSKKYSLPLIPFLLEGVAAEKKYNLADGIHPNEEGYKVIAKTVLKYLEPTL